MCLSKNDQIPPIMAIIMDFYFSLTKLVLVFTFKCSIYSYTFVSICATYFRYDTVEIVASGNDSSETLIFLNTWSFTAVTALFSLVTSAYSVAKQMVNWMIIWKSTKQVKHFWVIFINSCVWYGQQCAQWKNKQSTQNHI